MLSHISGPHKKPVAPKFNFISNSASFKIKGFREANNGCHSDKATEKAVEARNESRLKGKMFPTGSQCFPMGTYATIKAKQY